MNKAPVNKTLTINAEGILVMDDGLIGIENMESGEFVPLDVLFEDCADKIVSLSIAFSEDIC